MYTQFANQQEYFTALQQLFPTGRAWNTEDDTYLRRSLMAFSSMCNYVDQQSAEVVNECFPQTSTNLLPIWQETLALTAGTDTIQEQRSKVVAKLTQEGSLTRQYYINYAKQLGFTITIQEYGAVIPGVFRMGDTVGTTDDYSYEFQITIHTTGDIDSLKSFLDPLLPAYIQTFYVNT